MTDGLKRCGKIKGVKSLVVLEGCIAESFKLSILKSEGNGSTINPCADCVQILLIFAAKIVYNVIVSFTNI